MFIEAEKQKLTHNLTCTPKVFGVNLRCHGSARLGEAFAKTGGS